MNMTFVTEFRESRLEEVDFHKLMEVPGDTPREKILKLQAIMLEMDPKERIDLPLKHHFAPGVYGREILLPKGSLVIGKIHRHAHLNIISKGKVSVLTEFGVDHMEGPFTFTSKVGTKRVVYAHEDTIWTTIHLTDETDLEKIEAEVIAPDYEALEGAYITMTEKDQDLWGV